MLLTCCRHEYENFLSAETFAKDGYITAEM